MPLLRSAAGGGSCSRRSATDQGALDYLDAKGSANGVAARLRRSIYFFRLWRLARRRLRYLCLDIFLRRFLTSEPMDPLVAGR